MCKEGALIIVYSTSHGHYAGPRAYFFCVCASEGFAPGAEYCAGLALLLVCCGFSGTVPLLYI